ncbi:MULTISPECIES: hypothetical protein [unclassified Streptomyces]|uniref:Uncharacterized protein n=1 Tax=Streptomyces johnsoniae TaxID=3075532 RepID=A0ABU2RYU9_9ACTN|nr:MULTISPECIES: hypothetical protein [unclassified Streptomyces]MDT0441941.1 hypothetical protein [Streptomyces sp. DSM 41886]ONK13563.1 hypothetical protein STBA_43330 [Streptomyces sp. MP131-18]
MSTATVRPAAATPLVRAPRLLGTALRAVGVVAGAAFEVVVLGRVAEEALRYTPPSSSSPPAASTSPASMIR